MRPVVGYGADIDGAVEHLGGFVAAKKITRITVETETALLIRRGTLPHAWCAGCAAEVEAVTVDTLKVVANISAFVIESCLSVGQLHLCQAEDGSQLVCLNSLVRSLLKE
jgi:hypothetical protein